MMCRHIKYLIGREKFVKKPLNDLVKKTLKNGKPNSEGFVCVKTYRYRGSASSAAQRANYGFFGDGLQARVRTVNGEIQFQIRRKELA